MTAELSVDDLPASLQELAGLIGLAATLKLVEHWGGIRLYVPETVTRDHVLARRIGYEAACLLAEHYGKETVSVPRAEAAVRACRDREIIARMDDGESVAHLAREYAMTERGIYKLKARLGGAEDDRQQALFG